MNPQRRSQGTLSSSSGSGGHHPHPGGDLHQPSSTVFPPASDRHQPGQARSQAGGGGRNASPKSLPPFHPNPPLSHRTPLVQLTNDGRHGCASQHLAASPPPRCLRLGPAIGQSCPAKHLGEETMGMWKKNGLSERGITRGACQNEWGRKTAGRTNNLRESRKTAITRFKKKHTHTRQHPEVGCGAPNISRGATGLIGDRPQGITNK